MLRIWISVFFGFLCGFFMLTGSAGAQESLQLRIAATSDEYAFGDVPRLKVNWVNSDSNTPVTVIRPLDGSVSGMRMPQYLFRLEEGTTGGLGEPAGALCGTLNPLTEKDFLEIAPGSSVEIVPEENFLYTPWEMSSWMDPGVYYVSLSYTFSKDGEQRPEGVSRELWGEALEVDSLQSNIATFVVNEPSPQDAEILARFDRIQEGMSENEVVSRMGVPDQVRGNDSIYFLKDLPEGREKSVNLIVTIDPRTQSVERTQRLNMLYAS